MAGAQGVVLAPAAALDIGAGMHFAPTPQQPMGPRNDSRTVSVYEFVDNQDAQVLAAVLQKAKGEVILNHTAVQQCAQTGPLVQPDPGNLPEAGNVTSRGEENGSSLENMVA